MEEGKPLSLELGVERKERGDVISSFFTTMLEK
jgi:hypothetical protein